MPSAEEWTAKGTNPNPIPIPNPNPLPNPNPIPNPNPNNPNPIPNPNLKGLEKYGLICVGTGMQMCLVCLYGFKI